ncbi:MAG: ligase-associated DNA damage response endonuclease PdeM, partial [Flavobacteriales bacterium]|nr:ligase-associated DNA damage response endonuclease PdeM [Flavobacteriales bacterium]MDW8409666.1 ligase-associated DNA damage response endonuclease PdeM [Flavobacteriales bacterium]
MALGLRSVTAFGITLLPEGALWLPGESLLVVSDLHVGKSAHFRRHGVPVPWQTELKNFQKLEALLKRYEPKELLVLGDLFHSTSSYAVEAFGSWRSRQKGLKITLVKGNHDVLSESEYQAMDIYVTRWQHRKQLKFIHETTSIEGTEEALFVSGHMHPGFKVGLKRYPCFWLKAHNLVMPAFGHFTGFAEVKPQ